MGPLPSFVRLNSVTLLPGRLLILFDMVWKGERERQVSCLLFQAFGRKGRQKLRGMHE